MKRNDQSHVHTPIQNVKTYLIIDYQTFVGFLVQKIGDQYIKTKFISNPQTAEALNEHIRQIENETKVVEVMKSFPNDELVSFNSVVIVININFNTGS